MANELRLALLGGLQITRGDAPLPGFASHKGQALLCYLAHTRRAHTRDALAGLLWSEVPQEEARTSLRTVLSILRKVAAEHLTITRDTIAFNPDASYWLDVEEFQAKLRAASAAGGQMGHGLRDAVELYRGDFLEGFYVLQTPAFEEWMLGERQWLHSLATEALHTLAAQSTASGDVSSAIGYLNRLLVLEPWREEAHRQLMSLLAETGRRSGALAQYATCRRILLSELGVEPSDETTALYDQIVRGELGASVASPERSAAEVSRVPHNLPASLNPLLGRDVEILQISERLQRRELRLLSLVGAGGNGKTRLALEVASRMLGAFPDGVYFVSLAPLGQTQLVPGAIAYALGVQEDGGRSYLEALKSWLGERRALLVLDNFEHLVDAASVVTALLEAAPGLKVLVTSREPLHLNGEHQYPVPPLSVPDIEKLHPLASLGEYPAVALFAARAQSVQPGFEVTDANAGAIVDICRRLDGSPLAIELAAARVKGLAVAEIARRLDDRFRLLSLGSRNAPDRQQSLQASIDWSYDLLSSQDRQLLRRLSIFAGGWTIEAAEAIAGDKGLGSDAGLALEPWSLPSYVLDGVLRLVDKSLVVADAETGRYSMLETIRQYALEKLEEAGEVTAARTRHLEYFADWARAAEAELHGPAQVSWFDRLEQEHDNLRAAMDWALAAPERVHAGLRLAGAVAWFWYVRGHWREGAAWLQRLLTHDAGQADSPERVYALGGAAFLHCVLGQSSSAQALAEGSVAVARRLGVAGRQVLGRALWWAGAVIILRSEISRTEEQDLARRALEESVAVGREAGDIWAAAFSLYFTGRITLWQGDMPTTIRLHEESISLFRKIGDIHSEASVTGSLGEVMYLQGDPRAAAERFRKVLDLQREIGIKRDMAIALDWLGSMARLESEYERAEAYYEEACDLWRELGVGLLVAWPLLRLAHVVLRRGEPRRAESIFTEGMALFKEESLDLSGIAACLGGFAAVAAADGLPDRAARLFGASRALLNAQGVQLERVDADEDERNLEAVRSAMNEVDFASAWVAGQAMSLEEVVAYTSLPGPRVALRL